MKLIPKSVCCRLQFWYGALLAIVLCGFGLVAFHFEKTRRFQQIDAGLHKRLAIIVDALRNAPENGPTPEIQIHLSPTQASLFGNADDSFFYAVWSQGNEPVLTSAGAHSGIPKPVPADAFSRVRGAFRESYLFVAPSRCVLVGRSVAKEQADLQFLAAVLVAGGVLVLGAGILGGWWLSARALKPLASIGDTASKIASGDLSQRIPVAEGNYEFAQLVQLLNETFAKLDTAFTQQAQFTADAAHELRTPVSVMLMQTQSALTRERTPEEYKKTILACQRATQRMGSLIESLLELARMDAGQEAPVSKKCDLAAIAGECVELMRPMADNRGLRVITDFAPSPCHGDEGRLAQVFTNLLGNAVQYNEDDGEIRISTRHENGMAVAIVSNTGAGIDPENLSLIFERFYREDSARTGSHSGLGLAIVKSIVQAHGGSIEATSIPGKEATFTLRIP